jgi:hypothetical protein
MDTTLKIALISAIAIIVAALIKLLGDLFNKGTSGGRVVIVILVLLAGGVAILFLPTPPAASTTSPTPTQDIQPVLLRWSCESEHTVNANQPILIYYGGWRVKGLDLAQQWTTALDVNITLDGSPISGERHPPAEELPHNCKEDKEDVYWLYSTTTLSQLSPGIHEISVTFNILKGLPDGLGGDNYPLGTFEEFTFKVTAK